MLSLFCVQVQEKYWFSGLEGGPSFTYLRQGAVESFFDPAIMYAGGLSAEYHITQKLSIKSAVLFNQKGHEGSRPTDR